MIKREINRVQRISCQMYMIVMRMGRNGEEIIPYHIMCAKQKRRNRMERRELREIIKK